MAKNRSKFREYTEAIIIAIILALIIRTFVIQAFKIPSGSMIPTLVVGDHILVNKFIFGLKVPFIDNRYLVMKQPKRDDIVVFSFPGNRDIPECTSFSKNVSSRLKNVSNNINPAYLFKDDCRDFIKRVVGVGGDKVEIKNKKVFINNVAVKESFAVHNDKATTASRDDFGPKIVPHGKFFVMGDNRDYSYDSRFWGFVDINDIKGKAFIIYWSWDSQGTLFNKVRWDRISDLLH